MITITQNGYDFIYRSKRAGQQPVVETWGIERVAGFLFLVEWHRTRSQKYVSKFTLVSKLGAISYELEEFDKDTNHDVDKLSKLLLPYTGTEVESIFYTTFDKGLDLAEKLLKEKVKAPQEPVVAFGREFSLPALLTRPAREEYEAADLAKRQEMMSAEVNNLDGVILKVWFAKHGVLPCRVVDQDDKRYTIDVYLDGSVIDRCKVQKNSSRVRGQELVEKK